MGIHYVPGKYNAAPGTRAAFDGLSAALEAEGHPAMIVADGDREEADQLRIWHERMTLTPNGRKVYGTRWWQGRTWYQIHPDTVGIPGSSNHEKRRANDLKWPYNDQSTTAHKRARILATQHNITCEGLSFREPWHWTFWGSLGAIGSAAGGGSATTPEDIMNDAQERKLDSILHALGANGLVAGGWPDTIMGNTREIKEALSKISPRVANLDMQVTGADGFTPSLVGHVLDVKKLVGDIKTTGGQIDVEDLARKLRAGLPAEIVKALSVALAG